MNKLQSSLLKKGKKGFTLTELAIVIAVIAILIAVLVPTFTSVITNARKTTAAENATHAITEYTIETYESLADGTIIESGDYYLTITNGSVSKDYCEEIDTSKIASGYVQYVWDEDVDSALTDIKIYIQTTEITENLAESVAQNIANVYTAQTISYIAVEYKKGGSAAAKIKLTTETTTTNATYYYYSVTDGVVKSVTSPTLTSLETDKTYAGVIIYYAGSSASGTESTSSDSTSSDSTSNDSSSGESSSSASE